MRRIRGFTLLELMIVVAVVAILAAIAMSGYSKQMRKSRRAEAKQTIADVVLREEKWRTNNALYLGTDSTAANKALFGIPIPPGSYYTFAITTAESGTAYTITGAPTGDQAKDSCGTLGYAVSGAVVTKTPSSGCW